VLILFLLGSLAAAFGFVVLASGIMAQPSRPLTEVIPNPYTGLSPSCAPPRLRGNRLERASISHLAAGRPARISPGSSMVDSPAVESGRRSGAGSPGPSAQSCPSAGHRHLLSRGGDFDEHAA
jgi:hypothetical protein